MVTVSSAVLPASIDLRPRLADWGLPPRRQGPRGTCSVFAVTGALEYAVAHRRGHGVRLSVEFLNWAAHRAVGRREDGGFFSEIWAGYEAYGACAEEDLPYRPQFDPDLAPGNAACDGAQTLRAPGLRLLWIKEWDVETGATDAHLDEIRATIASGWPVCAGMRWPKQPAWQADTLQLCPPEQVFDGHSVLLVGYQDAPNPADGLFLMRNSGGEGRDGWLPYPFVRAYLNDAAVVKDEG